MILPFSFPKICWSACFQTIRTQFNARDLLRLCGHLFSQVWVKAHSILATTMSSSALSDLNSIGLFPHLQLRLSMILPPN